MSMPQAVTCCSTRRNRHSTETIPNRAAARARTATIHVHSGKGSACRRAGDGPPVSAPASGLKPPGGRLYPHTGQPDRNPSGVPEKPHFGQSTLVKKRPHSGQARAFLATSAPQLSQKNRGAFPDFRPCPRPPGLRPGAYRAPGLQSLMPRPAGGYRSWRRHSGQRPPLRLRKLHPSRFRPTCFRPPRLFWKRRRRPLRFLLPPAIRRLHVRSASRPAPRNFCPWSRSRRTRFP